MKQLLFLLLFPCLALAQYPGNSGQKITLGEQTSADGLVYRGLAADTTRKPSVDTMAYILLDTNTNIIWQYKKATNNAWTRVGGSISSGVTGTLPVANGGTGSNTKNFVDLTTTQNIGGEKTLTNSLNVTSSIRWASLRSTNAGTGYMDFFYNTNTLVGLLGNGSAILSGAADNEFVFRSEGNFVVANGNSRSLTVASGNVGIGTGSPQSGYKLHVVDSVYVGGNVSAAAYTTRSDYDLKDQIQNISYGLNEVMQMQPVKYTYKSNGSTQLGFIAQDIGVITPEVVSFEDKMSVYYNALIPILTKAIQEQQDLIKALEQRILTLENK